MLHFHLIMSSYISLLLAALRHFTPKCVHDGPDTALQQSGPNTEKGREPTTTLKILAIFSDRGSMIADLPTYKYNKPLGITRYHSTKLT